VSAPGPVQTARKNTVLFLRALFHSPPATMVGIGVSASLTRRDSAV
jgi:hypothetical protein